MKVCLLSRRAGVLPAVLLAFCCLTLPGCGGDDEEELFGGNPDNGMAPSALSGTTLVFTSSSGSQLMSVTHLSSSDLVMNDKVIDYAKYPPSYSYTRRGSNTAGYRVKATRVTYIPYLGSNYYSTFTFDLNLTFVAGGRHLYSGTQTNAQGTTSRISGTFTLKTE